MRLNARLKILMIGIYVLMVILIGRLFYLQVIQYDFFESKLKDQLKRIINIYPDRGRILDRYQTPLTLSKTVYSVYAVPSKIKDKYAAVQQLSQHLGLKKKFVYRQLKRDIPFVWIKRKVDEDIYQKVNALNINGLGFLKEQKRVFPHQMLASTVLGYVGIDDQGLGGLEYQYDEILKGVPGRIVLEGDPRGRRLVTGKMKTVQKALHGDTVVTTLDEYIQYISEKYLKMGVLAQDAKGGHVIVLDPKSGDILAMADYPGFNPNEWSSFKKKYRKNRCITDIFEPGSVLKPITIGAALEEEVFSQNTIITVPETLRVADRTINEAHRRKAGDTDQKTVTDILVESLNVGTSLIAAKLGQMRQYKYLRQFGLGERSGIELPGESIGLLRPEKTWSRVDYAMHSFGQGVAVTPLQLALAISVFANNGKLVKPRIIQHIASFDGSQLRSNPVIYRRQVVDKKVAKMVTDMMVKVVEEGTGRLVRIKGMSIAGKTGTAQKAREDGRGYEKGAYVSSFVGFFPADDPQFLILVSIDSPQKHYYGSTVAGPVFKNVANDIIRSRGLVLKKEP